MRHRPVIKTTCQAQVTERHGHPIVRVIDSMATNLHLVYVLIIEGSISQQAVSFDIAP